MGSKTIKDITATQTSVKDTDWFELQEDSSETSKKVQASAFGVPVGTIIMYAKATAPTNYLICDGAAVSRTTYATLFAVIGTAYGVGDNSTTFNLPDYQAVVPKGVGNQTINTRVKTGPASVGAKIEDTGQQITGSVDIMRGASDIVIVGESNGALSSISSAGTTVNGLLDRTSGTNNQSRISFDSANSTVAGGARTGTQTQDCSIGTNFCIKYQ